MDPAVTFNVGGTTFTTSRETLLKEAGSRLALMARGAIPCLRDTNGMVFIDRDPRHFQLILNFLRDGWCLLPTSAEQRRELLQEVRFYQLNGLELWLRTQEMMGDTSAAMGPGALEYQAFATESPHARTHYLAQPMGSPAPPLSTLTMPMQASPGVLRGGGGYQAAGSPSGIAGAALGTSRPATSLGPTAGFVPHLRSPYYVAGSGPGGGAGEAGGGGRSTSHVVASLREAFLAATGPQRPAAHVPAYSLPEGSEDSGSWTSKYLRGNEGIRELVNTLLELAYVPPHRALQVGRVQLSVRVACDHDRATSLVGAQQDLQRTKLLEVRVQGSTGWSFDLTVRPSSDAALWDKYGGVPAAVQDQWFVLGAVLKDCFGIVMEEDATARPSCVACRRTNLDLILNKIY